MLIALHQFLFYLHVTCGSIGLVAFWLPMLAKKGTAFHKKYGKVFTYCMFAVSLSGIAMSLMLLIDPIGVREPARNLSVSEAYDLAAQNRNLATFLLMLSLLVFTNVKHSLLVLKAKSDRSILRKPGHIVTISTLFVTGLVVGYFAITQSNILFMIFSFISVLSALGLSRYIFKENLKKREWLVEHLGNIIGSGIGAYTAFFAFGGRRFFSDLLQGQMQIIPWVLPSVIGIIASIYLTKKYSLQYKVA